MRILHIFDHSIPLHSGYSFRSQAILRAQRALGWETVHLTGPKHTAAAGAFIEQEEIEGLEFFRSPLPSGWINRAPVLNQWAVVTAIEQQLRHLIPILRPDILHAHSPALNGEGAVRAARRFGLPVVYEVRAFWEDAAANHGTSREWGARYRLVRALESRVLRRADGVVTICQGLRDEIMSRGIDPNKIAVVPNAVDTERFQLSGQADIELQRSLGLEGKRVLGFLGSFYDYEGLRLLLQVLPGLLRRYPDTRVLLTGGGPQAEALQALAHQLGVADAVVFTGRVPNSDVQRYYDLVDILVYPREQMRLTELVTPLKPLEAMAQGKLLIASDVGGHRELIHDGITGSLFKAGNVTSLEEAIVWLFEHPECWDERRAAGRAFVESERTWASSIQNYVPVYTRLMERNKCQRARQVSV